MTTLTADITIIGAGMAGASLVHLLAPARAAGMSVALIDRQPLQWQDDSDARPPSFDGRATALSFGTQEILNQLGLWDAIASHACPIEHIQVSDEGRFGQAHLHASEQGTPALGYIIENHQLGQALLRDIVNADDLLQLTPLSVEQVKMNADGALLQLSDGRKLQTRLLIMADGGRSPLMTQLGIQSKRNDYGTHALVTQVECDQPHNNWAYERFSQDGPIAFLPLHKNQYAVVWTLDADVIDAMLALDEVTLLAKLQQRIGHRVGRLTRIGSRVSYPLALVKASEQVRRSLVLLGNAAHSLQPVAGQGFNLTLRDAASLAEHLNKAAQDGLNPGDLNVLERYLKQQVTDQRNTVTASDWLPRLFAQPNALVACARDGGLLALAAMPTARRLFARHAMGQGQRAARIG